MTVRVPVPTNRIVALTLVGALLTGLVAAGLAFPGAFAGVVPVGDEQAGLSPADADSASQGTPTTPPRANESVAPAVGTRAASERTADGRPTAATAPTPNPNFTPSVRTGSRAGEEREDEHEAEREDEHGEEYEDEHEGETDDDHGEEYEDDHGEEREA